MDRKEQRAVAVQLRRAREADDVILRRSPSRLGAKRHLGIPDGGAAGEFMHEIPRCDLADRPPASRSAVGKAANDEHVVRDLSRLDVPEQVIPVSLADDMTGS